LVTTILSQSTTDANQFRAFDALRSRFPLWDEVVAAQTREVADAIRIAGLADQKAPRIQAVLAWAADHPRGADLEWLGEIPVADAISELVSLPGIGHKTAACVLCFSFDRPVLPVDTHVQRIALRTHMVPPGTSPRRTQENLSRRTPEGCHYAAHMQLIAHGRGVCRARQPRCDSCVLQELCPMGRPA
jgi:endonuclease-3